jgi:hypothetical protein
MHCDVLQQSVNQLSCRVSNFAAHPVDPGTQQTSAALHALTMKTGVA